MHNSTMRRICKQNPLPNMPSHPTQLLTHPHCLGPGELARRQLLLHCLEGVAPPQAGWLASCSKARAGWV